MPSTAKRFSLSPGLPYSPSSAVLKPLPTAGSAMRPSGRLGAGHRRNDFAEIKFERFREDGIGGCPRAEEALRLGIFLDQSNALRGARRGAEIGQRLVVDREEAAGRAIFRRHIADGGAIGQRESSKTRAVELDEFTDHTPVCAASGSRSKPDPSR